VHWLTGPAEQLPFDDADLDAVVATSPLSWRVMRSAKVAWVVAAMVVAGCCTATGIAQADPDPPPAPKTVIDHDGSYRVGTDIVPGTYRSDGPLEGSACYWKRLNGDQIIDNALTKKPQVVQIEPTDTVFKTDRCQPWQKTDCPPTCATTQQPPPGPPGDLKDFLPHAPPAPAPGGH
jgi:hypothetical protein